MLGLGLGYRLEIWLVLGLSSLPHRAAAARIIALVDKSVIGKG
jgi:hypothetical protein